MGDYRRQRATSKAKFDVTYLLLSIPDLRTRNLEVLDKAVLNRLDIE